MIKYGYITSLDFVKKEEEVTWTIKRKEKDGSIFEYTGIEFVNRADFEDITIVGDAQDFRNWIKEHGIIELI